MPKETPPINSGKPEEKSLTRKDLINLEIEKRLREKGIHAAPERLTEKQKLAVAKNVKSFAAKHLNQPVEERLAPMHERDLKIIKEAAEEKIKELRKKS